jgi:hypothetical protein
MVVCRVIMVAVHPIVQQMVRAVSNITLADKLKVYR